MSRISVRHWGAVGNGYADDTAALQAALDSGAGIITIPTGVYRITSTLFIQSHTQVIAAPTARIYLCGITKKHRGDFLLTNADHAAGNTEISITGGVWDGNNQGSGNAKPDIYDENGYSGAVLDFCNVQGLQLHDMVIANSVTYNIRMCKISDFVIEDIGFVSDVPGHNQDGLHFGGEVRHGQVRRIRALSKGQTNDDLLALNADDCLTRVENRDMVCGDIEDILFEDIFAEDCHTLLRLLSCTSAIRDITVRHVFAGYRCHFLNADAARYCRTPIFRDEDHPRGVGHLENIRIEDVVCYPTIPDFGANSNHRAAILLETHAKNLCIWNFSKVNRRLLEQPGDSLYAAKLPGAVLAIDGHDRRLDAFSDVLTAESLTDLEVYAEP